MSTAATVLSITTNLYLLYEVYHYFKQTQQLRDELQEKNKKIWDLKDKLSQKNNRRNASKK
ncbi:hypothetical protein [Bartonella grahamii]|uniref:hypothetical protein n=1 Tax=Bartonella grahamii TaxID=33045 RepID=UPI00031E64AF|nr:hypothetical protein [Bartonella grahamii]